MTSKQPALTEIPEDNVLADSQRAAIYQNMPIDPEDKVAMADGSVVINSGETASSGNDQAFNQRSPQLGLKACVALVGLYPSRS